MAEPHPHARRVRVLDASRFVDRLDVRDRARLFDLGRQVEFRPGALIMVEGRPADSVIVLREGQVKVVIGDGHGRTHLLAVQGPGDIVGEVTCVDDAARAASVTALSRVSGTRIACRAFLDYLREHPAAAIELLGIVTYRLRAADRRRLDLGNREVHPRLVRAIREVACAFQPTQTAGSVVIPLTQEELAQLISAACVSVQRALRGLRERFIVGTQYRGVTVPCLTCLDIEFAALATGKTAKAITGCGGTRGDH